MSPDWRTLLLVILIASKVNSALDYHDYNLTDLLPLLRNDYFCDNFLMSGHIMEMQIQNSLTKYLNYSLKGINKEMKLTCADFQGPIKEMNLYCPHKRIYDSCLQTINEASGVYRLKSKRKNAANASDLVYCLKDADGGNPWTLIQRRARDDVSFNRNWVDYENGFGNAYLSYWLGLKEIYARLVSTPHELWIEMQDYNNNTTYLRYDEFFIGNQYQQYNLVHLGKLNATTKNILKLGTQFSAKNKVNDRKFLNDIECMGAWWYGTTQDCKKDNLNVKYIEDGTIVRTPNGFLSRNAKNEESFFKYAHMAIREKTTE